MDPRHLPGKALPRFQAWDGFAVRKEGNTLLTLAYRNYETRNESTLALLSAACAEYGIGDFDWVMINTGDLEDPGLRSGNPLLVVDLDGNAFPYLSYSTADGRFDVTIPDFVFDHWRQTGLDDYETTRNALKRLDAPPPATDLLGWRGALTHPSRSALVALDDKTNFDCEFIVWDRSNPEKLVARNFLSFEQQVARWRYLIDVEGRGYSGRLKLLLCARRVVFIQERRHQEYFFQGLQPWVHYVPVRSDFSDLPANLARVKGDPALESAIIAQASAFAQMFLTRDFAKYRLANLLSAIPGRAASAPSARAR